MKNFSIVVAVDQKFGIGKNGRIPWHIADDMRHFRELTQKTADSNKQNAVIMGRKTWESLEERFRPLPRRINVVLTRDAQVRFSDGVLSAAGLDEALRVLSEVPLSGKVENIFVIGGGEVYRQAIFHKNCEKVYLTQIFQIFDCDTFIPDFQKEFKKSCQSEIRHEKTLDYCFQEFVR